MKHLSFLTPFLLLLLTGFIPENKNNEWKLYHSNNAVDIFFKYADCNLEMGYDQEWVLLKFINKTEQQKIIEYDKIIEIDSVCITCEYSAEYHMTINIKPNEIIEGSCSIYDNASSHFYSKMIEPGVNITSKLTRFELGNLKIR